MKLEHKIERQLWDMLCTGGGDDESIKAWAKKITEVAYRHQRSHPRNMRGG